MNLETLIGTLKGHIFHLELNRPKQMNAMSSQLFKDLQSAQEYISALPDVRVVVLTGRGKHFCVGLDLKEAPQMFQFSDDLDQARKSIRTYDLLKDWQKSMTLPERLRVPVIAAVQGFCIGGAIDLISSADIRYCSRDAKFTIKEIDNGMYEYLQRAKSPDLGTIQRLSKQSSNSSLYRELAYTGRFFTAQEALILGLVSKIVNAEDLEKEAFALAETIASKSPVGIYTIKSILKRESNVDDNLDVMARTNMGMIFTNDVQEAIQSTLLKKKPEFPKL